MIDRYLHACMGEEQATKDHKRANKNILQKFNPSALREENIAKKVGRIK